MTTYLRAAAIIALCITVPLSGTSARQIAQAAVESYSDRCDEDSLDVAGIPVDDIRQLAQPTDEQRAVLDELGNASVQAAQIVKASCPTQIASTAIDQLDGLQQRVQAMLKAVNLEQPVLAKFYDGLSDEQKARLNALTQKQQAPTNGGSTPMAGCRSRVIPDWPSAQILRDVHPTPMQRTLLEALQGASTKARSILEASCANAMPVTPPARLSAIEQRLHAVLVAIGTVRGPLNEFYRALSDQQKARFNAISRSGVRRKGGG
jgi:hypothetical protein